MIVFLIFEKWWTGDVFFTVIFSLITVLRLHSTTIKFHIATVYSIGIMSAFDIKRFEECMRPQFRRPHEENYCIFITIKVKIVQDSLVTPLEFFLYLLMHETCIFCPYQKIFWKLLHGAQIIMLIIMCYMMKMLHTLPTDSHQNVSSIHWCEVVNSWWIPFKITFFTSKQWWL